MVQPHRQIQQHQRPLVVVVVLGKCSPPTAVHLFVVVVVAAVAAAAAAEIHSGCYFLYSSFFFSSGLDSRYNWWWWWSHSLSCQRSIHLLPLSCSLGFSSRSHTKPPIGKKETKAPLPSKVLGPNAATIKRSNNHQATNLSSSLFSLWRVQKRACFLTTRRIGVRRHDRVVLGDLAVTTQSEC